MNTAEGNRQGQYKLLFDVRRSVRYHIKRRQFLDHLGKFFKIFTTIGGLGTITTILAKAGEGWTFFYGTLVGVFSIIDLVIGTDESARLHGDLAREFINLERQMVLAGNEISDKELAAFNGSRLEIEAKEPPALKVLDVICHNELATAMGLPESEQSEKLTWAQKLLAPIHDVSPDSLKKRRP